MRALAFLIVAATTGMLAACGEPTPDSSEDASTLPETQNAPVDADPTPQTGTGGEQQPAQPQAPAAQ